MSFRLDPDPPFASVVAIEPHRAARRDTNGSDRWLTWLGDACDPDNMHVEHGCDRSPKSSRKRKRKATRSSYRHSAPRPGSRNGSGCTRNCPHSSGAKNPCRSIGLACHVAVEFCTHHKAYIYIGPRQLRTKILSERVRAASRTVGVWALDVGRPLREGEWGRYRHRALFC